MEENNAIVELEEKRALVKKEEERTLFHEIAIAMDKGYKRVQEVIDKLYEDTRTEDLEDDEGNHIGQRTHVHPQLLKWITEARHYENDMWKLGGGEIAQEAQKKQLEIKAKLIMKLLSADPDKRDEMVEKWKQSKSYKT
jgi:hypothetical protein